MYFKGVEVVTRKDEIEVLYESMRTLQKAASAISFILFSCTLKVLIYKTTTEENLE